MKRYVAIVLMLSCLLTSACTGSSGNPTASFAVVSADYPQMARYPDESKFTAANGDFDIDGFSKVYDEWTASRNAQRLRAGRDSPGDLESYYKRTIRRYLSGADGENRVFSPLNVYIALAMLAELSDGTSRSQILDLLCVEDIETLRQRASDLWNMHYCDDGAVTSVLANSLWMNQDIDFVRSTMETLAKVYYASSFRGEMGSPEFDKALQSWIDEQTGGMLSEQASGLKMDPRTILTLVSTIYFRAKWASEFSPDQTGPRVFHGAGGDVKTDFMHQSRAQNYYWGERYAAVRQDLEGSGGMYLILPDEGVTPEDLLADEEFMNNFFHSTHSGPQYIGVPGIVQPNVKELVVHLAVPKFDVVSDLDLIPGLQDLGVTAVFDPEQSDFSPMTEQVREIFVSQAKHAARVVIDEEGCTAAAYTVIAACGAGMPPDDEIDFVVDRPFLFLLAGHDGRPLFVGVVHRVD